MGNAATPVLSHRTGVGTDTCQLLLLVGTSEPSLRAQAAEKQGGLSLAFRSLLPKWGSPPLPRDKCPPTDPLGAAQWAVGPCQSQPEPRTPRRALHPLAPPRPTAGKRFRPKPRSPLHTAGQPGHEGPRRLQPGHRSQGETRGQAGQAAPQGSLRSPAPGRGGDGTHTAHRRPHPARHQRRGPVPPPALHSQPVCSQ